MRETGRVIEVNEGIARVEIERGNMCGDCKGCIAVAGNTMIAEVDNIIHAKENDIVEVEIEGASVVKASFIVYIVPIICFFLGFLVTDGLMNLLGVGAGDETAGILGGVVFFVGSFVTIHIWDRRVRKSPRFKPRIVNIVVSPNLDEPEPKRFF